MGSLLLNAVLCRHFKKQTSKLRLLKMKLIFFSLAVTFAYGMAPVPLVARDGHANESCAGIPVWMQHAKIVGGAEAQTMIPWQVALLSDNFQFCGGTILDSCTILSAAHCGINKAHTIRAGSKKRKQGGQVRSIQRIISNTDLPYNDITSDNDWVILKLSSPLELNDKVFPACLPEADYLDISSTEEACFTSGWGTLASGGQSTNKLQWVRVPAITNADCDSDYGGGITDSMICAGYRGEGGKDACRGDSGGPFVCQDENNRAIIAGVVSWGYGCAHPDYPGVYARVTTALDWIKTNLGMCDALPSPSPTTAAPPADACGSPQWANDEYCDDDNNNEACGWDGGACCGNDVLAFFCSDCSCLDPNAPDRPEDACGSPQWFNDTYCDDDNNNEECGWDGGDCCGDDIKTDYCNDCDCLDPNAPEECKNILKNKECAKKAKNKKFCTKNYGKKNCALTCKECCGDVWGEKKCEKQIKKNSKFCKKNAGKKNCALSCDKCKN